MPQLKKHIAIGEVEVTRENRGSMFSVRDYYTAAPPTRREIKGGDEEIALCCSRSCIACFLASSLLRPLPWYGMQAFFCHCRTLFVFLSHGHTRPHFVARCYLSLKGCVFMPFLKVPVPFHTVKPPPQLCTLLPSPSRLFLWHAKKSCSQREPTHGTLYDQLSNAIESR